MKLSPVRESEYDRGPQEDEKASKMIDEKAEEKEMRVTEETQESSRSHSLRL